jgi:hypothetical protein
VAKKESSIICLLWLNLTRHQAEASKFRHTITFPARSILILLSLPSSGLPYFFSATPSIFHHSTSHASNKHSPGRSGAGDWI